MTNAAPPKLSLLAKLVLAFILVMIVAGVVWHGVSVPTFQRIWHDLVTRPDAPMRFRFILQPLMVAILAVRHGRTTRGPDARPIFGRYWATRGSALNGCTKA